MKKTGENAMKLIVAAILTVSLLLTGCGKKAEKAEEPAPTAEATVTEAPTAAPTATPKTTASAAPMAQAAVAEAGCDHADTVYQILENCGCYTVGRGQTVCAHCGEVLSTISIPASGHAFNCMSNETGHWKKCGRCGEQTILVAHEFNSNHVCTVCGYGCTHAYTDTVTAPTCTAEGFTVHTCKLCGCSFADSFTTPKGHSYVSTVETKATCTAEGVMRHTCTACGDSFTTVIRALGHHTVTDAAVEATCRCTGLTEGSHCDRCGTVLVRQEELPTIEHVYMEGKCLICGETAPAGDSSFHELPADPF